MLVERPRAESDTGCEPHTLPPNVSQQAAIRIVHEISAEIRDVAQAVLGLDR
jgi:hypothetical protein